MHTLLKNVTPFIENLKNATGDTKKWKIDENWKPLSFTLRERPGRGEAIILKEVIDVLPRSPLRLWLLPK